jgi:hypothetical protein
MVAHRAWQPLCPPPVLNSHPMLALNDQRWATLLGGYRVLYDPRSALARLQNSQNAAAVWSELWNELHHQGDVDLASYAAVPHLVGIYESRPSQDWNVYAIVGTIELARGQRKNPDVPSWLADGYFLSIQDLARLGLQELAGSSNPELVRAVLSLVALAKGARTHAKFLLNYSEDELQDFEGQIFDRP